MGAVRKRKYVCTRCGRTVEHDEHKECHAFNSPPECCGERMMIAS